MSTAANGGPAFPMGANEYSGTGPEWGMTLRDYFAAKAIALPEMEHVGAQERAAFAYQIADAMLAERAK